MDENYYYTEQEWARMVGYGQVPENRQVPPQHWNGEQQLNKSTGQVEVWHNGDWYIR